MRELLNVLTSTPHVLSGVELSTLSKSEIRIPKDRRRVRSHPVSKHLVKLRVKCLYIWKSGLGERERERLIIDEEIEAILTNPCSLVSSRITIFFWC